MQENIHNALHLIETARYLLDDEIENAEKTPESRALIDAETALCIALKAMHRPQESASGIDLSAAITEAKRQRSEKEEAQQHNNRLKLALENLSKQMGEEIKAMFAANGFEIGIHCQNWKCDYGHDESILISITSRNMMHNFCWVSVDYEKYHLLSTGERFPLLKGEPYLAARGGKRKVNNLQQFARDYKEQMTDAIKWLLNPSVI